jgi:hypothetical protein
MRAHLRLLDPDTGEILDGCPNCQVKDDEFNELLRKFRSQSREIAELRRDREAEARSSDYWPDAVECFQAWQDQCKHPKSEWSAERFFLVLPFLKRRAYGKEMVLRAIAGAAYDAFEYTLRNGRKQRADNWEQIFESVGRFERFCNMAPLDWRAE